MKTTSKHDWEQIKVERLQSKEGRGPYTYLEKTRYHTQLYRLSASLENISSDSHQITGREHNPTSRKIFIGIKD